MSKFKVGDKVKTPDGTERIIFEVCDGYYTLESLFNPGKSAPLTWCDEELRAVEKPIDTRDARIAELEERLTKFECEVCDGSGEVDNSLGGVGPSAHTKYPCSDCNGTGSPQLRKLEVVNQKLVAALEELEKYKPKPKIEVRYVLVDVYGANVSTIKECDSDNVKYTFTDKVLTKVELRQPDGSWK